MRFINRHVLRHSGLVFATTMLLYWGIAKPFPSGLLLFVAIVYILTLPISALLNHRADEYQGYVGFNYHLFTYLISIGLPLALKSAGYLTNVSFVRDMAFTWGIGIVIHLLVLIIVRKKIIGGYEKQEIFE